ncbi:MAG TPA: hypothetical protein VGS79_12450 [Puia sp.]|nr:hypothetical protein [Puia sp.]
MSTQGVFLSLDTLNLSSKGPGRSPFLWAVFFKIDQDSLPGATCFFSTGDHRDLGVPGMSPGTMIPVPDALNSYSSSVTTIEIGSTILPAMFGVAAILMNDGGHVTAHGIAAGHAALNTGVQTVLDGLVASAIETQQAPTQSDIGNAINGYDFKGKVAAAVKNAQSFWENLWAWSGEDTEIGMAFQTWTQDDFNSSADTKPFALTIADVWTFNGNVTLADECPASTSAALLDPFFNFTPVPEKKRRPLVPSLSFLLDLMRDFRDKKRMLKETYLDDWWTLAKRHTPEFAYRLTAHKEVRDGLLVLTQHLVRHLQNDELIISRETIGYIDYFLDKLSADASLRFKKDIEETLSLVPLLYNKTLSEALRFAATRSMVAATPSSSSLLSRSSSLRR